MNEKSLINFDKVTHLKCTIISINLHVYFNALCAGFRFDISDFFV